MTTPDVAERDSEEHEPGVAETPDSTSKHSHTLEQVNMMLDCMVE